MTLNGSLDAMGDWTRTHGAGELRLPAVGTNVTLMGWVDTKRDHGGLVFVDLRDRTGRVQLVFDPSENEDDYQRAGELKGEYVIAVRGEVVARDPELINPEMPTGEVEVVPSELRVLNEAKTPPIDVSGDQFAEEVLRLKHRYLDLRTPRMQENIILRHRLVKSVRDFCDEEGFVEIETPMLTKSTPEGARDYLVPSREHPGEFYALPQSPQLFKQLLMVAGFEKYVQIVRCFRDEDLRADRQPEFTQVDVELSFANEEVVYEVTERMMEAAFDDVFDSELATPFPRLTYAEAMNRFGSDKPDLRYGLELCDVSGVVASSEFRIFSGTVSSGGVVKGLALPGGAELSRSEIDALSEVVESRGAKGLAWIALGTEEESMFADLRSPIAKFLSEEELRGLAEEMEAEPGALLLFVAANRRTANRSLGALRVHLADAYELIPEETVWRFLWVTQFPLLEWNEDEERFVAMHHPFTAPVPEDVELLESEPGSVRARAYDLVLNGVELGGGSIRIHQRDLQERVFRVLDMSEEEQREKFGFLLDAFEYGTPPHGGIALGLDRTAMLLAGASTIRAVIAFPKTTSASCLLTGAPTEVSGEQLNELGLQLAEEN